MARATQELDDLLRPSLTHADDAVGFDRPYDPSSLWIASFFGGPFTAALLFALNAKRLGQRRQIGPIFLGLSLLGVLATLVYVYLDQEAAWSSRDVRLLGRAFGILAGAGGWVLQRRRFRLFSIGGGEPARALGMCLGGIAYGLVLTFAFGLVALLFVGAQS